jgi:hypothetical protein
MRQYVGDIECDDNLPRAVETAGGGVTWRASAHALSAFACCARQLGVDVELVLRAAQTGRLGELIATRARSRRRPLDPRKAGMGARSPWDCYTVLAHKRYPAF